MDDEKRDLSYPGAAEGMTFHVRGRKLSKPAQDKIDEIVADTPVVNFGTRDQLMIALQRRTTSGVTLAKSDCDFFLAVVNQIAAGLRPSEVFKSFGLTYSDFKSILDRDTRLMDLYKQTISMGQEARAMILEDEALRRAVEGVDKPVYYKGKRVATDKEYSDPVLLAMLKAHAPDRYADRSVVQHGGTVLQLNIEGVRGQDGKVDLKPPAINVTPIDEEDNDGQQ